MTEAEIAQALQARLAVPVKIAVKRRQAHLHVLLNRSPQTQLDYPHLTQQVRAALEALGLSGLEQVTVYGRASGHSEYEWQQTQPLRDPLLSAEETTLVLEKQGNRLLQDLTLVAPDSAGPQPEPKEKGPGQKAAGKGGSPIAWLWPAGAVLMVGMAVAVLLLFFL
ncbi:hypothetical protein ACVW0Q_001726 [Thermostichus sp. MS-CIW-21]|jgi:hypothetical protein|uniref:hypothetical protein n=1 Tax=unclassified Synechococcus TaxID=2626047 RepID=UPI0002F1E279|nr:MULTISPECIES: hypothetical protein [unclassified Synechococcus]PIK86144.1 hypothetical protein SYN63AY4M2_06635 [Synechococcus sp. 63AY4M2]PIK89385.1 hypothetical protein SYN65AY6A5_10340 [Synechococcus sp. 65AY6A5]PIK91501.1 hypothetical protein SYN65AY6LI_04110 [Synechococcus sp. 65AY6Li]PIK95211.1 hypothetical protein SYN60AY4M2_07235 [Synechococcus sp. 60AY4M2]PIK97454.1 hypothetical protein SYN63AY4M1_04630 [Synechococcus sp. 63AY4M1]